MKSARTITPLAIAGFLFLGCQNSEPAATTATAAPPPPPVQPVQQPVVTAPVAVAVNLPTSVEYEKKAETEITADNMAKQLEDLEKQIK